MQFAKLHGAGNDFVVVDSRGLDIDWNQFAQLVCDRHLGIGADGLILAMNSETADLRMRMFNPDGTEAEMCGNGIRCLAKFAIDHQIVNSTEIPLKIETLAGILDLRPIFNNGSMVRARVGMGYPRLHPSDIPVDLNERFTLLGGQSSIASFNSGSTHQFVLVNDDLVFDWPFITQGKQFKLTAVNMGNPHAVAFMDVPVEDVELSKIGPEVEHHPLFPQRVNFEIANVIDRRHITARVWERGAGLTMACGSGASAIAVAARLHGFIDDIVDITLPGGILELTWDGQDQVYLEGPVISVFGGDWP